MDTNDPIESTEFLQSEDEPKTTWKTVAELYLKRYIEEKFSLEELSKSEAYTAIMVAAYNELIYKKEIPPYDSDPELEKELLAKAKYYGEHLSTKALIRLAKGIWVLENMADKYLRELNAKQHAAAEQPNRHTEDKEDKGDKQLLLAPAEFDDSAPKSALYNLYRKNFTKGD